MHRVTLATVHAAHTSAELASLYESWIGYNPYEDEPEITDADVREILIDYVAEFNYASKVGTA